MIDFTTGNRKLQATETLTRMADIALLLEASGIEVGIAAYNKHSESGLHIYDVFALKTWLDERGIRYEIEERMSEDFPAELNATINELKVSAYFNRNEWEEEQNAQSYE